MGPSSGFATARAGIARARQRRCARLEVQRARAPACAVLLAGPAQNNLGAPAKYAIDAIALDVQCRRRLPPIVIPQPDGVSRDDASDWPIVCSGSRERAGHLLTVLLQDEDQGGCSCGRATRPRAADVGGGLSAGIARQHQNRESDEEYQGGLLPHVSHVSTSRLWFLTLCVWRSPCTPFPGS